MIEEIWRDIKDYEGLYQVSNLGEVKSLNYHRTREEKIIKPSRHCSGYLQVCLCKDCEQKVLKVHRLVAAAFIPNPENKPCIDHINAIRDDNRVENLRWVTPKENSGNPITMSKISRKVLQFTKDGVFVRKWNSMIDVERELGRLSNIAACCRGKRKTCGGFVWKYAE